MTKMCCSDGDIEGCECYEKGYSQAQQDELLFLNHIWDYGISSIELEKRIKKLEGKK